MTKAIQKEVLKIKMQGLRKHIELSLAKRFQHTTNIEKEIYN